MANPHCVCPASGFCDRHKIVKNDSDFAACRGNASTSDGGRKMWMAWERGMLGATAPAPETRIENPQPFRVHQSPPQPISGRMLLPDELSREHLSIIDSYRKPYDYPPIEEACMNEAVRHLTFHLWPVANVGAWQWNCDRLIERADLFNGRRIVAIVTSHESDTADAVKHYLRDFTNDFVVIRNDPRIREVATWVPMLKMLEQYQSENDVTFSCHGKCVRHFVSPDVKKTTIFAWTKAMYDTCLHWGSVWPLLEQFATVGSFRRLQSHMTGRGGFGPWHYSGAFYWWRNRDVYRRNWMYTPNHFFGTEAWPGIVFTKQESGVIFSDDTGDLYDLNYFENSIVPRLDSWKTNSHSQHRMRVAHAES